MEYRELVDKCKKAFKENDLTSAYEYWVKIYDLLDEKLNQYDKTDEKNRFVCYDEFNKCMREFTDDEVYKITDYGKEKAYREMERERIQSIFDESIKLYDLTKDEKMKSLDDFLSFYEWCVLKSEDKEGLYNIYDLQTSEIIDEYSECDEKDKTLTELVLRLVERALCYELDEHSESLDDEEYEENYNSKYIQDLLNIQEEYIEKRKEELTKELEYEEKRLDYCAYGKSDLHNIEHLKYVIKSLDDDYERWR